MSAAVSAEMFVRCDFAAAFLTLSHLFATVKLKLANTSLISKLTTVGLFHDVKTQEGFTNDNFISVAEGLTLSG